MINLLDRRLYIHFFGFKVRFAQIFERMRKHVLFILLQNVARTVYTIAFVVQIGIIVVQQFMCVLIVGLRVVAVHRRTEFALLEVYVR